jgi:hypothetical protein
MSCRFQMIIDGRSVIPRSCPTCGIFGGCHKGLSDPYARVERVDPGVNKSEAEANRKAYEIWAKNRPHWTEACYEAYCAGLVDGKPMQATA